MVVDAKEALLYGEAIFVKFLQGYYSKTVHLKLLKNIYEFKQAVMALWVELL